MKLNTFVLILSVAACASLQAQVNFNLNPTKVAGQATFTGSAMNLVEGRELNGPLGVALDTTVNPPRVYVADTNNNRVLGWKNAYSFTNGLMAEIVIGQRDFVSTGVLGPNTTLSSGLYTPTSVAVDKWGNLWVVDSGNNRILRYKQPFSQTLPVLADFVIGQPSLGSRQSNNRFISDTPVNARGISTSPNSAIPCNPCLQANVAFDSGNNLWFTDSGNHRVLRFPSTKLPGASDGSISVDGVQADLVLGQSTFTTNTPATRDAAGQKSHTAMYVPSAIAFDPSGGLWVSDNLSRALYYKAAVFTSGQTADRLLGIAVIAPGSGIPPVNLVGFSLATAFFFVNGQPYIADQYYNRILRYDTPDKWQAEDLTSQRVDAISPAAIGVIGQDDYNGWYSNRGLTAETSDIGFNNPTAAVVAPNNEVFIADGANHRMIVLADPSSGPPTSKGPPYNAIRVLGQDSFHGSAANFIEGRELSALPALPSGAAANFGMGMAVDATSITTPPRLYIADTGNHRVLGFKDAYRVQPGDKADIVIGQVDLTRRLMNSPNNDPRKPTATGLYIPTGLGVDANGNLWVADYGNGRIVRFPQPFNQTGPQTADMVIGQASFTAQSTDVTAQGLNGPYALAFFGDGSLAVSDNIASRILYYPVPLTTGMAATKVLGQTDFFSVTTGSGMSQLKVPLGIAIDGDDRVYSCDYGNNRIQLFDRVPLAPATGAAAGFSVTDHVNAPYSIDVSKATGEFWAAMFSSNAVLRYPKYVDLIFNPLANFALPAAGPIGVRLDPAQNLIIADAANRMAFHFPSVSLSNSGSGFLRIAPGMLSSLYLQATTPKIADQDILYPSTPWLTTLNDVKVYVNGVAAPLYYVGGSTWQINFQVPGGTPLSGTVDIYVQKDSTGQVLGATRVVMSQASPAFFTTNQSGSGQIAALNQDNTYNSAVPISGVTAKAARYGETVQMFMTGQGPFAGMPADGAPSPGGPTPFPPGGLLVNIGGKNATVGYNGLAPGYVGLWQLNVVVPNNVAGTSPNPPWNVTVVVVWNTISSNTNPVTGAKIVTTIAVTP